MMESIKEIIEFFCWVVQGIINAVFSVVLLLFVFCLSVGVVVVLFKLSQFIWINTTDILDTNKILEYLNPTTR